jgi:Zn-finger nucleic acid-binding protein
MMLTCPICKLEFPIPKVSSKLYYTCPKCKSVIQLWGYRETATKKAMELPKWNIGV